VGEADAGDVGGLEAPLVELPVEARARRGAEVRAGAGIEGDADGTIHAGGAGVEVGAGDGAEAVDLDAVVHAVATHDEAHGPVAGGGSSGHLVRARELDHELLRSVERVIARHQRETQHGAGKTGPERTTHFNLHHVSAGASPWTASMSCVSLGLYHAPSEAGGAPPRNTRALRPVSSA